MVRQPSPHATWNPFQKLALTFRFLKRHSNKHRPHGVPNLRQHSRRPLVQLFARLMDRNRNQHRDRMRLSSWPHAHRQQICPLEQAQPNLLNAIADSPQRYISEQLVPNGRLVAGIPRQTFAGRMARYATNK